MPPRTHVKLTGDWNRATRFFNGFVFRLQSAVAKGSEEDAQAFLRRLQMNLYRQTYAGDWPPLGDWAKDPEKVDPRMLLNKHDYVRSMKVVKAGRGGWSVGVTDSKQAIKGLVHEYGGRAGNSGAYIPARPHWRVEMERFRQGVRRGGIAKALEAALNDERGLGGRILPGFDDDGEGEE